MTGLPASEGSSSTSTDAKNASMSTWRMVGTALLTVPGASGWPGGPDGEPSATEGQPAEPLGVGDTGPPALLDRPSSHRLARPAVLAAELGAVALDRCRLGLDRVGDVDPFVGLERARE